MLTLSAMFALMMVYCTGCSPCERLARLCPPQVSKSETHYVHDTTFVTKWQTDTSMMLALQQELSRVSALYQDTAHAETSYAIAQAWCTGGRIELGLWNKPVAPVYVPVYHEREETIHQEASNTTNTEVHEVYKTPLIMQIGALIGLLSVI